MASKSILVVEDEMVNSYFLSEILKLEKYQVYTADNGKLAIEFLKQNSNIDLILMDVRMPVMNGVEASKIIHELYPDIIIIAQTAFSPDDKVYDLEDGKFHGFVRKPIIRKDLMQLISSYLA